MTAQPGEGRGRHRPGAGSGPGGVPRYEPRRWVGTVLVLLAGVGWLVAQPEPRIGYVYPAGGQVGTTFEVTVGGRNLARVDRVWFSGEGVEGEVVEYHRPMAPGRFNQLREELRQLAEKRRAWMSTRRSGDSESASQQSWTEEDAERWEQILNQIMKNPPNRNATPAVAETVRLRVRIGETVEPGELEIRLAGPAGVSNPLRFCVDRLPEKSEPPAQMPNPELERFLARLGRRPDPVVTSGVPVQVELPVILNGQILPGTTDRYTFQARRGQRVVAALQARALIPYLADAVPGWFQARLALFDAGGREIAGCDDFRFDPDPVLMCEIPADGLYTLEVRDALFRGREDFVYRLTLGELPRVTDVFPLGGPLGEPLELELSGWNLPVRRVTIPTRDLQHGLQRVPLRSEGFELGRAWVQLDTLPERLEAEPNDHSAEAPLLQLPCVVNGWIDRPGDVDVYRFRGRAGQTVVLEVWARRLGSPLDARLACGGGKDEILATVDDVPDPACGWVTHQADPYLRLTLPEDGEYWVRLTEVQGKGGPAHAYRLRIDEARPDFALRWTPSSLTVRPGGVVTGAVHVIRRDGFEGAIELVLCDGPPGAVLVPSRVPAGTNRMEVRLRVPAGTRRGFWPLKLEGRANVAGESVVRTVEPAEEWMQAFFYRHLLPAADLWLTVTGRLAGAPARRQAAAAGRGTTHPGAVGRDDPARPSGR
ncbi:MAG: hypothetical protein KatS3mg132_546 [Limisphaera sp.]|nr:MAG: hypothetical protein KatS3mg132_546 [Limisphaera sp.]